MKRLSDHIAALVTAEINALEIPGALKDQLEWEILPIALSAPGGGLGVTWLIGIGVPVPGTGDWEFPFRVLSDPHGKSEVRELVKSMYAVAQAAADTAQLKARAAGNGHRMSRGGLELP
ncbi:MAG: hypothetical protein JWM19_1012 [Actinomycetia bacterium]|nr:hypothetical protein [Actinomycetes bacterium]